MKRLLLCLFLLVACGQPTPMTSGYVVEQFKGAGLSISAIQPMDMPFASAVEGTQFELPNVGNGKVLTFASASDATDYRSGAWRFQKGIVVIELSTSVDPATAQQYEQVLNGLRF